MRTISVLHVPGCAGGAAALEIARGVAETHPGVAVEEIVVDSPDQAEILRFRGSPTVLIDGVDVEPQPQAIGGPPPLHVLDDVGVCL